MDRQRTSERLRVDVPTLDADPVFLDALASLSAASHPTAHRPTRSAGLRSLVAAASVAAVAIATWAAGYPTGGDNPPLVPADSPTQLETTAPPSRGDLGTPHSEVSISPGSPTSPGLPGENPSLTDPSAEHATDDAEDGRRTPGNRSSRPDKPSHGDRAEKAKKSEKAEKSKREKRKKAKKSQGRGAGEDDRADDGRSVDWDDRWQWGDDTDRDRSYDGRDRGRDDQWRGR